MSKLSPRARYALLLMVGLACLDQLFGALPSLNTSLGFYAIEIIIPLVAVVACCWRARDLTDRARVVWLLLAAGLAVWTCAMAISIWEEHMLDIPFQIAGVSDFAFFFYGVPILFSLAMPVDGLRISLFRWLDGFQALFAGYLTYVTIFSVLPFSSQPLHPVPTSLIVLTYNIENVILAVCCAIRLAAAPRGGEQWRYYRTLLIFLLCYAVGVGVYNRLEMLTAGHSGATLLADVALLLLPVLIALLPPASATLPEDEPESAAIAASRQRKPLVLFVDNVSPILITLALLALGMDVLREHFRLGAGAICVALAVYGVRTTILQLKYREVQQELQAARDRLEEMSLQDALTGIANRRCFDRAIESEWHRAMRTQNPMALLMLDLDHFKQVNDRFGHPYGDRCLIQIASALRAVASRSGDLVARYGGEEFAVILPSTTGEAAEMLAIQMQSAVRALEIATGSQNGIFVSISIGISTFCYPEPGSPELLIEAADRALYRAKNSGRDRIEKAAMAELVSR